MWRDLIGRYRTIESVEAGSSQCVFSLLYPPKEQAAQSEGLGGHALSELRNPCVHTCIIARHDREGAFIFNASLATHGRSSYYLLNISLIAEDAWVCISQSFDEAFDTDISYFGKGYVDTVTVIVPSAKEEAISS
jgi:hypothetical protein